MGRLRAEGIVVGYGGPPIVQEASVFVDAGRIAVILGPNGAGKSTLAKAIVGLLRIAAGHVRLNDQEVTGQPPYRLVRLGIGYLPQLANVFSEMTVLENLEMGAFTYRGDIKKRLDDVTALFPDLGGVLKKKASQLSGGQQRMVALARALMVDPKVIILDEPTAGLSPIYAERVWEHIVRVRETGVGLLVVEQNARMAMEHADHVFVMANGRNALSGPAAELIGKDEVAALLVG
ncbi:MAG TPA: ABC transporter ATP-binding protein [Bacillota bacterium]|nr:ABC transporter ATP-binding protein [Bacillota bacterium]